MRHKGSLNSRDDGYERDGGELAGRELFVELAAHRLYLFFEISSGARDPGPSEEAVPGHM